MVTNCSKERPGSIVNETLKNGILMLKGTSKESNFHADSKYVSFIKFIFVIKSYEPEKICLIVENRGKHPLKVKESEQKSHHRIQRIRKPWRKNFKLLPTKCGISYFLPEDRSRVRVYFYLFLFYFFSRGHRIDQMVLESPKRAHYNRNEKF